MRTPAPDSREETPTLRRRFASMAYESLLLLGVLSACFMLPHLALGMAFDIALPGWVLWAHVFIVLGGYFAWYWLHGGQTLAMQTWRIRLSTPDGGDPSMTQLVLRYFLAWPSVTCLGAGLMWAIFDRDRQFLHDRLAGTRLVLKRR